MPINILVLFTLSMLLCGSASAVDLQGRSPGAHNKLIVIDAGSPEAMGITGSYNFTRAAQSKNAENVVLISDNESLVQAYVKNWHRHVVHSQPLTIH